MISYLAFGSDLPSTTVGELNGLPFGKAICDKSLKAIRDHFGKWMILLIDRYSILTPNPCKVAMSISNQG